MVESKGRRPVEIEGFFHLVLEDRVDQFLAERRASRRKPIIRLVATVRWILTLPFVLLCAVTLVLTTIGIFLPAAEWTLAHRFFSLLGGALLFSLFGLCTHLLSGRLWAEPWDLRRSLHTQRRRPMPISIRATENRLEFRGGITHENLLWGSIDCVVESRRGFVVYFPSGETYWIPTRAFPAGPSAFAELTRTKVSHYIRIRRAGRAIVFRNPILEYIRRCLAGVI